MSRVLVKSIIFRVERAVRYLFDVHKKEKKIGFWLNEEYTYDHYKNVLMLMEKGRFELILDDKFKLDNHSQFLAVIRANEFNFVYFSDVLDVKKYSVLITHLAFGEGCIELPSIFARLGHITISIINSIMVLFGRPPSLICSKQYFQRRLGFANYRFMYGADLNDRLWPSNGLYDLFFCHGPNDADEMLGLHNKPIVIMGYPRYDRFFEDSNDIERLTSIKNKLGCSPGRLTILWITTVSTEFSTIATYSPAMAALTDNYNVILRPHPLEIEPTSTRYKQNVRDIADSGTFLSNTKYFDDLCELYLVADMVLVDYGGAIFSAVYLGKKILLLNHPKAKDDRGILESNSVDARKFLPSIDPENAQNIGRYISEPDFWDSWHDSQEACRVKYFGKNRGGSAQVVATYLNDLDLSR